MCVVYLDAGRRGVREVENLQSTLETLETLQSTLYRRFAVALLTLQSQESRAYLGVSLDFAESSELWGGFG